jgi:DMSO/TMAO reductase YedYZ molybdopterin-dependent catalytic subunit
MPSLAELKVPVFWAEGKPEIPEGGYLLAIGGLVRKRLDLSIAEILRLATDEVECRLTSVTRWSVRATWRGILARRIAGMVGPDPDAGYVRLASFGGVYVTVVARDDLEHPRAILAVAANGEPLSVDYGGPIRAVFPHLWGYKSAKSLVRLDFVAEYESGYWERRGYEGDAAIAPGKLFDLNSRTTRDHAGGEVVW